MFEPSDDPLALAAMPANVAERASNARVRFDSAVVDEFLIRGAQCEWDLDRRQIAVFTRNPLGIDAVEPAAICSLDEWLSAIVSSDRHKVGEKMAAVVAGAARSFERNSASQPSAAAPSGLTCAGSSSAITCSAPAHHLAAKPAQQRRHAATVARAQRISRPADGRAKPLGVRPALAEAADAPGLRFAILFVDLDGFKTVNDRHGHLAGDRTLVAVSRRLANCVRPGDLLARRGGDEFTVLLRDVAGRDDALAAANRILQQLRAPISLDGLRLAISASIGIALSGDEPASVEALLATADSAMYRAKKLGGCQAVVGSV